MEHITKPQLTFALGEQLVPDVEYELNGYDGFLALLTGDHLKTQVPDFIRTFGRDEKGKSELERIEEDIFQVADIVGYFTSILKNASKAVVAYGPDNAINGIAWVGKIGHSLYGKILVDPKYKKLYPIILKTLIIDVLSDPKIPGLDFNTYDDDKELFQSCRLMMNDPDIVRIVDLDGHGYAVEANEADMSKISKATYVNFSFKKRLLDDFDPRIRMLPKGPDVPVSPQ